MKITLTGVVAQKAHDGFHKVANDSVKTLNAAISNSNLSELDFELSYCPIILSDEDREIYPSRSYYDSSEKVYYCSPYLEYDKFISSSERVAKNEFLNGIMNVKTFLEKFGASKEQIQEFDQIITTGLD